ncbi:DUF2723 domain-containing protein [Ferruginibacter sp. HRS2-29]|uniref:glycosyltransferase family 117 protein n=1 Tax=Ferruginibacter sp. HRS2-29 TaxID=2487334 RepID=UPI0020CFA99D|nr:DUF2723 domain-containing protein [Ferruginibacter sp. HRS2-29]MCP9752317.1 DUF2723 domain-containing protein [Ferruginibacter sp. HRS2-29]
MTFKRINNITGWVVCIIACSVYILTMEATGSFWDCGEFASSAYKLQVPHSPGAPFFVLIGRLFMAPFGPEHAATGINLMSALASGFTILFLFWTITHFAKKLLVKDNEQPDGGKLFAIMAAGVVGALAYTFSDSFWYSAVEGEVYALSSFFTALLFWLMLKWENNVTAEQLAGIKGHFTKADRWIILIFFLMGLSIGVHLLNLLTIPAIVMIYYFKRYRVTKWRTFFAFIIGCVITGFMQKALIQWTVKDAGNLDILFKNNFGLPFFSGFAFYFIVVVLLLLIGLRFREEKVTKAKMGIWFGSLIAFLILPAILYSGDDGLGGRIFVRIIIIGAAVAGTYFVKLSNLKFLKLSLWCFLFILLGCFSSYFTTLVRSNANVALDMNEVDNPVNFLSYLSREQYGDWPILYGQDFTDQVQDYKMVNSYVKGKDKYELSGRKLESYVYAPGATHFFPRMWDASNDQGRADYYAAWMGLQQNPGTDSFKKDSDGNYLTEDGEVAKPSIGDNFKFFMAYQMNWMYFRYFMWNFAGKQNDNQGVYMNNVRDGNWKTGIGFIDKIRLGDQSTLPDTLKNNKANNKLFALPFILGLLGLFYQAKKDDRDALVTGLLFFFTGIAIAFYLNMAGNQPRERDYAFVGSFYAFSIWIGLGVLYVKDLFFSATKNAKTAGYAAALVCLLAVPVLMASQEWDDHDRSKKVLARDLAIDYLQSCEKNAILITFGDNDTYPLWYAQEVQGIRTDVRVINSSLLGTDWYINQLRYKVNDSDPMDPIWSAEQIEGSKRDVVYNAPVAGTDPSRPMDLYTMMKDYAGSDDPSKVMVREGSTLNLFPTRKVTVPVDENFVRQNKTVNANDSVVKQLEFEIPKSALYKNDAAILNIIASNKWKRPIYFTSPYDNLGFQNYLRQDGLSYRLVPVLNMSNDVNKDWIFDKLMNTFVFGGADKAGVYFDEENRRHLNSIRLAYAQASGNLAEGGEEGKAKARKMLNRCDQMMLDGNFPYGYTSRGQQHNQISFQFLIAAYKAEDMKLVEKVTASLKKDIEQQQVYYQSLEGWKREALEREEARNENFLRGLEQIKQEFSKRTAIPQETGTTIPPPTDTNK